jgi:signal peptidase I
VSWNWFQRRTPTTGESSGDGKKSPRPANQDGLRETVESVVFAFVLAFLFRTFEAEAFVIPTGSMAPTLYGRHKEANCTQCGFPIVIGASEEIDQERGFLKPHTRIETAVCPNCRYATPVRDALAFNGDRILVTKYSYEFGEPQRWDVFVFKFPEQPKTNYIKRLVGLPNETVRIRDGDIYLWDQDHGEQIQRKADPDKQRQIQIPVYVDDHPPRRLLEAGWPERFTPMDPRPGSELIEWTPTLSGWQHDREARRFQLGGGAPSEQLHWIRYRHLVPTPDEWELVLAGKEVRPRPQLISDFCGYNAIDGQGDIRREGVDLGALWVGDLTLNLELRIDSVTADDAEILLELCEGVHWYRCRIDPRAGKARLVEVSVQIDQERELPLAEADVSLSGSGTWELSFANVDDRLCLWIDDVLVEFGDGALLSREAATLPLAIGSDLTPVGIAARGVEAHVAHLSIDRDIYYRNTFTESDGRYATIDRLHAELGTYLHDPQAWTARYAERAPLVSVRDYVLGPDDFLALGDNSPRSRDSRLWATDTSVPREFLVGKAFWIYWPHGVPFLNNGRGYAVRYHKTPGPRGGLVSHRDYPKYTVPFYPQVERMTRIR